MPDYTLVDLKTGDSLSLWDYEMLRRQYLRPGCVLLKEDEHIGIITGRDLVLFARWCAGETASQLRAELDQSVTRIMALVDKWLEDEKSVTRVELGAAGDTFVRAWHAQHRGENAGARAVWGLAQTAEAIAGAAEAAKAGEATVEASWMHRAVCCVTEVAEAMTESDTSIEAQIQWFVEHLKSGK